MLYGKANINAIQKDNTRWARYYFRGGRIYATIQENVGVHVEATNVTALADSELLLFDNEWGNALPIIQGKKKLFLCL